MIHTLQDAQKQSSAEISTFGARVLSWNHAGRDMLFMPALGDSDERAAPHGGIPVLFPQFGLFGPGRKHGVVRDMVWELDTRGDDFLVMRCKLAQDAHVPEAEVCLRVELTPEGLKTYFSVTNSSAETIRFTCGLHTYLRVSDVAAVQLTGLENTAWHDALNGLQARAPASTPLSGPVNVDRVYVDAPARLALLDSGASVMIEQAGFSDTVVWNPGAELASDLSDLQNEAWRHFLCVEAAQIMTPVELPAGATWQGHQRIQLEYA